MPTTPAAAQSPKLDLGRSSRPFLDIFKNPNTETTRSPPSGAAYQEIFESFIDKYQAGQVDDLQAGLEDSTQQIDAQEENASGGGRRRDAPPRMSTRSRPAAPAAARPSPAR